MPTKSNSFNIAIAPPLEIIKKVNPQKAYLTHISHQLGLFDEVSKEIPENVYLAYDRLVLEVLV